MIFYLIGNVARLPKISLEVFCDVCVPIPPPNVNFSLLGQRCEAVWNFSGWVGRIGSTGTVIIELTQLKLS